MHDDTGKSVLMSLDEFETEKSYWLNKLTGCTNGAGLMYDFKKTADCRKEQCTMYFDEDLSQNLYQISKGMDISLYVILLSAFKAVLYKYTGQEDVAVLSPVYKADNGTSKYNDFVSIRDIINDDMTLRDVLNSVKESVAEAYKNQHYPIDRIIDMLGDEVSRQYLFRTAFALENIHDKEAADKLIKCVDNDITILAFRSENSIEGSIYYNTNHFSEDTIKQFSRLYTNFLKVMLDNRETKLSEAELITDKEKRRIIYDFNFSGKAAPTDRTLHRIFEEQVDNAPDHIAIVFGNEQLTYRELDERANRLANYIYCEYGPKPDTLVGIIMEQSIDRIAAILGILKAGCAYIPIETDIPEERIKTYVNDAGLQLVISSKKHIKLLNRLQWECASLKAFLCMDVDDVYSVDEESSELMSSNLWEYVGENASDEIEGGGWMNSYTGENISKLEMDEYGDNALKKLMPYLGKKVRLLEIGCASGISMFRIAPLVELYYGTDLSRVIIEKNIEKIKKEGTTNIKLKCLPAHRIDEVEEEGFDIVVINSVIQCFSGHNYLRKVINKAVKLLKPQGIIFFGDIMDQDKKSELVESLVNFKQNNRGKGYKTKVDWSSELFLSRSFFEDMRYEVNGIKSVAFSDKIRTVENELTLFRYDAIAKIDKGSPLPEEAGRKNKFQLDAGTLKKYGAERPAVDVKPENLAYIIYTSGSTGKPKGVMIEHKSIPRVVKNTNYIDITPGDKLLQLSNYAFDGSMFDIFGALLNGAELVLVEKEMALDVNALARLIQDRGITMFFVTTALFNVLVDLKVECLKNVRKIIFGGERASIEHSRKALEYLGKGRVINGYGPTETTVFSTTYPIDGLGDASAPIPIGKPLANTSCYIKDGSNHLLPVGVVGELCVSGDGIARGYLNNPGLTKERFIDNPFEAGGLMYRTGDLARWLPDGNIEFVGRIDHQVKIRGFRIELGEIEVQIEKYESVKEAVVIDRQDSSGYKFVCAYFVASEQIAEAELKEYLGLYFPDYMIPGYFMQLDKMPLTKNGKIDRKALPDFHTQIEENENYQPPSNELEEKLAEIWRDILGVGRIGVNDNFFESGGHSLKATILASKIHKAFNVEIPLREIFSNQTIKQLSKVIENSEKNLYSSIQPLLKEDYYPLSSAQKRMFVLNQLQGIDTSYNMSDIIVLEGSLDRVRFEDTWKKLIIRHESLRTSFEFIDGQPVQRIHEAVEFNIDYFEADEDEAESILRQYMRPFDLSKAPLLRVCLIKLSESRHILLKDMHHIISDGTSLGILVDEFSRLYAGETLPELRIQYKDYSTWQNDLFKSEVMKLQEQYWLGRFGDEIPVLNLPTDYKRPLTQSFEGFRLQFEFDEELTKSLNTLAVNTGSTMYMVLLSIYNILLSKYTGQEDIIVGTPIAGRPHADLHNIVGMFVNTLAMRNFPSGSMTYKEFLGSVRENALRAYENQDYQFEELVEKANIKRDFGRNPLFDTMFALQNIETGNFEVGNLSFSSHKIDKRTSTFDMFLNAVEADNKLNFYIDFCTKLFREETIRRLIGHFENIARCVAEKPEIKLEDIIMMSDAEKSKILYEFNDTDSSFPRTKTLHELFEEQAGKIPSNTALLFGSQKLTYRELNMKSNRLARRLISKGVSRGSIVAIMAERSFELLIGILAILKSGGAYLPIDVNYPEERISYILKDSGAVLMLKKSGLKGSSELECLNLDDEGAYMEDGTNCAAASTPSDPAYVIYTSGSTGIPKGVMIEHAPAVNILTALQQKFPLNEEDTYLLKTAYTFDVSVAELFGWFMGGGKLAILGPNAEKDPYRILEAIDNYGVTHINFVPSMLNAFIGILQMEDIDKFEKLKYVFAAGEALPGSTAEKLKAVTQKVRLENIYGPTESTIYATSYSLKDFNGGGNVPIGKPLPNIKTYVVDKNLNIQPLGVAGELCISGISLARGYLNNPGLTEEKFVPNPFLEGERMYRTGDLARVLPDGNIEFLGRNDYQVKIRGFRIELGEIENVLAKHPAVKEAVVTDMADDGGNRFICAYMVPNEEIAEADIKQYLSKKLPEYMVPSCFIKIEDMPHTASGKIDRRALPKPGSITAPEIEYEEPRNEVQKILVEIWEEVLGKKGLGIKGGFFELGGDSIKAIQIVARLHRYNLKLEVREILQNKSIEEISQCVKTLGRKIDQQAVEGKIKLSPIQKWFFDMDFTDKHHWNQSVMLYSRKGFDAEIVKNIFDEIVKHHDTLRMVYQFQEGCITQYNLGIEDSMTDFTVVDMKNDSQARAKIEKASLEIQSGMDLAKGPLVKLCIFKSDEGDHLLIAVHHLVIDGVSWRIIFEDFVTGYSQVLNKQSIKLQPKTDSFRYWNEKLAEYANSEKLLQEKEFWKAVEQTEIMPVPRDHQVPGSRQKDSRSVSASLSDTLTGSLLRDVNKAYNTEINDILLTALAMTLSQWSGEPRVLINLEGHGREELFEDVDITRTVGWFTSLYPVVLEVLPGKDLPAQIKHVKEGLRKIPHKGVGYGICKYLTAPENKQDMVFRLKPEICFNYLGQFDSDVNNHIFEVSPYSTGPLLSPESERAYLLDISAVMSEGRLVLTFNYSSREYEEQSMKLLLNSYRDNIGKIIEHCIATEDTGLTPSDLDYKGLSIDELDDISEFFENI